jgi:hypothetical protein
MCTGIIVEEKLLQQLRSVAGKYSELKLIC